MIFGKKPSGGAQFLIAGLGNPGFQYDMTRHNTGFMTVDELASRTGCAVTKAKYNALFGQCELNGRRCIIAKPQTYMNNSGEAIAPLAAFYKIPPENIIVICDDISLDVGRLRIRRKGSDGGHNGLKSISLHIGDDYPRIKVGIGKKPHPDYDLAAWVLSKFTDDERAPLRDAIGHACDAIALMVNGETDKAMNKFNS